MHAAQFWANRAAKVVLRSCALQGENKDRAHGHRHVIYRAGAAAGAQVQEGQGLHGWHGFA